MAVPYFKHGRRHATNGEDPIPGMGTTTVIGVGGGSEATSGGTLLVRMSECYTNDTTNMGYIGDTGTRFNYVKVTQSGIYQIVAALSWNSDFTSGDAPYIELMTYYPSGGTGSTLASSIAFYDMQFNFGGGAIWAQQNDTSEYNNHALMDFATVVFDPSDSNNGWYGETYTGFGANIRTSVDRTKNWYLQLAVTRLGPVGSLVYDGGPV